MAMKNSDTVLPTCRNPGTLDMADTAEAGTDVSSRGLKRRRRGVCGCPYVGGIGEAKRRWVLEKGLPVSEVMMSSLVLRNVTEAQGCSKALQMVMENWKVLNMSFRRSTFYWFPLVFTRFG